MITLARNARQERFAGTWDFGDKPAVLGVALTAQWALLGEERMPMPPLGTRVFIDPREEEGWRLLGDVVEDVQRKLNCSERQTRGATRVAMRGRISRNQDGGKNAHHVGT